MPGATKQIEWNINNLQTQFNMQGKLFIKQYIFLQTEVLIKYLVNGLPHHVSLKM